MAKKKTKAKSKSSKNKVKKGKAKVISPFAKTTENKEEGKLSTSEVKLDEDSKSEAKAETKKVSKVVDEKEDDGVIHKLAPERVEPVDRSIGKTPKQLILEQHGGVESNIPINSGYWHMK